MNEDLASPAVWDLVKEEPFLSLPTQETKSWPAWLGSGKSLEEPQIRFLEALKGYGYYCVADSIKKPTQELLVMPHLWIPQIAHGCPWCSAHFTHTHTYHMALHSPCSWQWWQQAMADSWWAYSERWPKSADQREITNLTFSSAFGKQKKGCQHLAQCAARSREGIQS